MKNLKIIMACGFCFLLGASVPIKLIHAQADKLPEAYYMLSFMRLSLARTHSKWSGNSGNRYKESVLIRGTQTLGQL